MAIHKYRSFYIHVEVFLGASCKVISVLKALPFVMPLAAFLLLQNELQTGLDRQLLKCYHNILHTAYNRLHVS